MGAARDNLTEGQGGGTPELRPRRFYKLSGSGNDFVFFDVRHEPAGPLEAPEAIEAICARRTGIGADGVVFLEGAGRAAFAIRYYNSDGSRAELCGNASLCSIRLAIELGIVNAGDEIAFDTDAGRLAGRVRDGLPEIDLAPVAALSDYFAAPLAEREARMGYALVGVPHLAVLCEDCNLVDVHGRGAVLRRWPTLEAGANVNFVSRSGQGWRFRTFERGVEAETLACGTGAVATAALLRAWHLSGNETTLETRSGRPLRVRFDSAAGVNKPSLAGEGRLVYSGRIGELATAR